MYDKTPNVLKNKHKGKQELTVKDEGLRKENMGEEKTFSGYCVHSSETSKVQLQVHNV